ncbi:MAG: IPT/TIG domain-containing protein [Kiritimatiellia bacterium]|nr:IPT/TIG domain-containing protein [Kiritimatiellia bacterium]
MRIKFITIAGVCLLAATSPAYDLSRTNGPSAGGTLLLITNCAPDIGNGSDITNVAFGGVGTTNITGQGAAWVRVVTPERPPATNVNIDIFSTSQGQTTYANAFTFNSWGVIIGTGIGSWTEVTGLPVPRASSAAAVFNNRLYVIAGFDGTTRTNVFCFDGTNWTEVAGLPSARHSLGAGVLNGRLYVFGGRNGATYSTNTYCFDGTNWTEVAGLSIAIGGMASSVFQGALYSVAGQSSLGSQTTNVYRFDGTNWMEVAGLPAARKYMAAGTLPHYLYAAGGDFNNDVHNAVYRFDGTSWTQTDNLVGGRNHHAAAVINGSMYALGGHYSEPPNKTSLWTVIRCDGAKWKSVANLPEKRHGLVAGVLDGRVYAVGGACGSEYRTNVYCYVPPAGVVTSSCSARGGVTVTIMGTNLCDRTTNDIQSVTLCGVPAAVLSVAGSTQIVVRAGYAGMGIREDVRVQSDAYGITVASNAFEYLMPCKGTIFRFY